MVEACDREGAGHICLSWEQINRPRSAAGADRGVNRGLRPLLAGCRCRARRLNVSAPRVRTFAGRIAEAIYRPEADLQLEKSPAFTQRRLLTDVFRKWNPERTWVDWTGGRERARVEQKIKRIRQRSALLSAGLEYLRSMQPVRQVGGRLS